MPITTDDSGGDGAGDAAFSVDDTGKKLDASASSGLGPIQTADMFEDRTRRARRTKCSKG